jgi:agmatine deiminase
MAWPHEATDWKPYLPQVQKTFATIIAHASHHARVILVTNAPNEASQFLHQTEADLSRITFAPIASNDTWARDFGPITITENHHPVLLDFQFNGWGGKFKADLDNVISRLLKSHGIFGATHLRHIHLILEGGGIESDGQGSILTTRSCLANPNRNPHLSTTDVENALRQFLGATRILWLENGYLAGDDTDGHIDMLARFAPHDTIVHVACDNPDDEHYSSIGAMVEELRALRTLSGAPYRLLALPWPEAKHAADGHRIPASYANFLILNGAVLVPTYNDPRDKSALGIIAQAYPGRRIIGIDCSDLILQHGSLHCVTMQLPKGVLA